MKPKGLLVIIAIASMLLLPPASVLADSHADTIAFYKSEPAVRPFFDTAYGYAVFPMIGKGGIVVGAAYGKGKVYRGGVATGTVTTGKMTIGLQLGGQAFSQIIFFQDERAYNEFTSGSFELDMNVSAVAVTAGVQANAGTMGASAGASAGPSTGSQAETRYHKGMVIFVHARGGLMVEAAVGGQRFDFEPYQQ
jgi:lipid-binding SYLF domain-containing protein